MFPIQLQILSDLHLETPATRPTYAEFSITPRCPNLALLGDIGNVLDPLLLEFLGIQLQKFELVFLVLGNHEPYGSSYPATKQLIRGFEERVNVPREGRGRFVFLDQTRFDFGDSVTVLGCTFFSRISPSQSASISRFVSDFSNIDDWDVAAHNAAHAADLAWLNAEVARIEQEEPQRAIVVLTHYSPTLLAAANDPRHVGDEAGVRSAFVTDVSAEVCWRSKSVRVWGFGHTHCCCDFVDAGKRVVANQKGYRRTESLGFDGEKVIEIEAPGVMGGGRMGERGRQKGERRRSQNCIIL
ncbi:hypothetical protein K432DRAFT_356359 [Lepidopterella palustris CBS 459.81]|uniref:Calcineurin-like phosphoesterase domain-containing protein n=1 Tax=Lepidopterella palustris CBS 459.81 TaxID=1314670 RepID=A0A8E2E7N0_9PEZI|nr:hypothetical protein K432DRAFT_356359 [Lepidopterella palustris CBS 459.81]